MPLLYVIEYVTDDLEIKPNMENKIYDYHNWDIQLELKCVKPSESIFIHRALNKEELTENDKVFISDGRLAKFIDIPKIRFVFDK